MAQVAASESRPGVLDFYRVLWASARAASDRYRLAIAVEVGFVVVYVVLRSTGLGRDALIFWLIATLLLSVVSPASGLVVLAAIAPFSEPLVFTRQLGAKPVIVVALALGVALRLIPSMVRDVRAGTLGRPPWPIVFGALVALATALGVAHSYLRFGAGFGVDAAQSWLAGIGGLLVVLGTAWWAARGGNYRPLVAAVVAGAVGGVVSLGDWLHATALRESPLGWLLRPNRFAARLTGIISSPNGVASLVVIPTAILATAAVFARRPTLRVAAAALVVPLLATLYFTYSRAALLGVFAIAVIVAWQVRRGLGAAILVLGLVAGIALLPSYLATRAGATGSAVDPSGVLVASDRERLGAWAAAGRMALDSPLTGHGFLSYSQLHEAYGDPILRAPHNEWLRLFAEEGVPGGLAGIAFAVTTVVVLVRADRHLTTGVAAAFAAWALTATFNNPTGFIQVGIVLGCVVGVGLAAAAAGNGDPGLARASPRGAVPGRDPAAA